MYLIKTNPWNHKDYIYDINQENINSDMFNQNLHDNNALPQVIDPYVCGYCNTRFCSRNRLFYHLAFMGIDTRDSSKIEEEPEIKDQVVKNRKRRQKFTKWTQKRLEKENMREIKRTKLNDLEMTIKRLSL
jgi:siroheme synthase (precorrin-2 oxidase/ferrochelatase)